LDDVKITARLWSENAESWARDLRGGLDIINDSFGLPFFVSQLPDLNGQCVLDAGCGEGRSTRAIAQKGATVIGVDISSTMLAIANNEETHNPKGIKYIEASCHALDPIKSNSIDVITSYMALMDMPDIDRAINEFSRTLKSHGELFIMVRHPCFLTPGFSIFNTKNENRAGLTISQYFQDNSYLDTFRFGGPPSNEFTMLRFPYTLSKYIESLINSGFSIQTIQEPRPTETLCATYPRLEFWRKHAACFLFLRAKLG
jgi:SAM-dependent methyltransferase